jgi:cell wall-associated NlpC family hydrolase
MSVAAETLDPRCHPYRPDLAAEELRGRVAAQRYVRGELRQVARGTTALLRRPEERAAWASEALFGELVTVYEEAQGWAWGQLQRDGYVGYLSAAALSTEIAVATHRVQALGTFLYPMADIKAAPLMPLSMNAAVAVAERDGAFARLVDGRFVPARHLAAANLPAPDFVAIAAAFLGVPYLWGGKTRLGVDCSGLLQLALHAAGYLCPRDSDMQRALGSTIAVGADLAELVRGDLVFWQGHVGMMADAAMLLHANAHHMAVVLEPLAEVVARQQGQGSPLAAVRRLVPAVRGAVGAREASLGRP